MSEGDVWARADGRDGELGLAAEGDEAAPLHLCIYNGKVLRLAIALYLANAGEEETRRRVLSGRRSGKPSAPSHLHFSLLTSSAMDAISVLEAACCWIDIKHGERGGARCPYRKELDVVVEDGEASGAGIVSAQTSQATRHQRKH